MVLTHAIELWLFFILQRRADAWQSAGMASKKRSTALTPAAFFSTACPRVLSILRETCSKLGGRYVIHVTDSGSWTVDFPTQTVTAGAADAADLTITCSAAQFESLQSPKVELKKLIASGALKAEGDLARVENVSLVLAFLSR
jgi:hypothetical protein